MKKRLFKMSKEQLETLLEACRSGPAIMLQCGPLRDPQENANDAWKALGEELGFDHMTVEACGSDQREFLAMAVTDE